MDWKFCKTYHDNKCEDQTECDEDTCKRFVRDEDRAECGCPVDDVNVTWCDCCQVTTVFCNCNSYGTCQCS